MQIEVRGVNGWNIESWVFFWQRNITFFYTECYRLRFVDAIVLMAADLNQA